MTLAMRSSQTDVEGAVDQIDVDHFHNFVMPTITARRRRDTDAKRQMLEVSKHFHNADYVIPQFNVQNTFESGIASQLIADAIETTARRAADSKAGISCPAVPGAGGRSANNQSRSRAALRKKAYMARWKSSQYHVLKSKLFRHQAAYATYCMGVVPDNENGQAKIVVRSPLNAYPESVASTEVRAVRNIGFVYQISREELIAMYGKYNPHLETYLNQSYSGNDAPWDIVSWYDDKVTMVGLIGQHQATTTASYSWRTQQETATEEGSTGGFLISSTPNPVGKCTWICPQSMSLDGLYSAMNRIIPTAAALQKIASLEYFAVEKSVVPDRYVIAADNMTPRIVGGEWHPGRTGKMNLIRNAKGVGEMQSQPGVGTIPLKSALERSARMSVGNPATLDGDASGSLRSGNTVEALGAVSVDPMIREMHEVMETAMEVVNTFIAETELAYWPSKKYQAATGLRGDSTHVLYVPRDIWTESTDSSVNYPIPGMDVFNTTQAVQAMTGAGLISEETGRDMHPWVHDAEGEADQILVSTMRKILMGSVEQQAQGGQFPITDIVALIDQLKKGLDFEDAFTKVQEAAQERQATEAAEAQEGQIAAPEAMPGVNAEGIGGEQPMPGGPPGAAPPPGLAEMLGQLGAAPPGAPVPGAV